METDWEREYYALSFIFGKLKSRVEVLEMDNSLMKTGLLVLADPRLWKDTFHVKFAQDILDKLELDNE